MSKGGFRWALQTSAGSLESFNVIFFEPTICQGWSWKWNFMKLEEHLVLDLTVRFELLVPKGGSIGPCRPQLGY